jgi:hypothetical protein
LSFAPFFRLSIPFFCLFYFAKDLLKPDPINLLPSPVCFAPATATPPNFAFASPLRHPLPTSSPIDSGYLRSAFKTMDGVDITKAVLNKGKQMASVAASAANGNGGKKRRKGTDLKPIVTNETAADSTAATTEG